MTPQKVPTSDEVRKATKRLEDLRYDLKKLTRVEKERLQIEKLILARMVSDGEKDEKQGETAVQEGQESAEEQVVRDLRNTGEGSEDVPYPE